MSIIKDRITSHIDAATSLLEDDAICQSIQITIENCIKAFRNRGKLLICGNGGSAADAQHLAAEFSGRFYLDRPPLFAEALHVNTSYLTAVANDYSYEVVFERMVEAMGRKGDMLWCLSTSGNSPNVLAAAKKAKQLEMQTVSFTGISGGLLKEHCDINLTMPSKITPRIQELHMLVGHIICEEVEAALFS